MSKTLVNYYTSHNAQDLMQGAAIFATHGGPNVN